MTDPTTYPLWKKVFIAALLLTAVAAMNIPVRRMERSYPESFGPVSILAYTPWDPSNVTWLTASGRSIQNSDYSVAVSKDVESWLGGISNSKVMHIPGYCKAGEWAYVNDRSDQATKTIEVLITAPADKTAMQERARQWGNKTGTLYKMQTPAGTVAWVEMEK